MENKNESWKIVPRTANKYEASNLGRVRKVSDGKVLRCDNRQGLISLNGKVRRLGHVILETFVCDRPPGYYCWHNDGDNRHASLANIKWHMGRSRGNKFTRAEVEHIRELYAAGDTSMTKLSKMYGVSHVAISKIVNYKTWK